MEKTELEKRWEKELSEEVNEAKIPINGDNFKNKGVEKELNAPESEEYEADEEFSFVMSPFTQDTPMVLVSSNNKLFIGGYDLEYSKGEALPDDLCVITFPVAYSESFEKTSDNTIAFYPVMRRILFGTKTPDNMVFRVDMFYYLRRDSSKDLNLFNYYIKTVKESVAQDFSVLAPTTNEVLSFGRKDHENNAK
ncbi:MAG: hypothetical protein MUF50_04710 [Planctomycetes bacterium]|jgi:hypothetical protein|nr:hypothetical protein [Planctomycetota bacterium]